MPVHAFGSSEFSSHRLKAVEIDDPSEVPERRMMRAYLWRALKDAECHTSCGDYQYSRQMIERRLETITWLQSSSTDPYSFLWVCEWLPITSRGFERIRHQSEIWKQEAQEQLSLLPEDRLKGRGYGRRLRWAEAA